MAAAALRVAQTGVLGDPIAIPGNPPTLCGTPKAVANHWRETGCAHFTHPQEPLANVQALPRAARAANRPQQFESNGKSVYDGEDREEIDNKQ